MGSVTDPYQPVEIESQTTRHCLEAFAAHPVARLVLQTRSILVERDLERLASLSFAQLNLTVETDDIEIHRRFTRSTASPARRLEVARRARDAGVFVTITVSPLLPVRDVTRFADDIAAACDFAVVDTLTLGDGASGARSRRNGMAALLTDTGFPGFMDDTRPAEVLLDALTDRLGANRVGLSQQGFTAAQQGSDSGVGVDP